MLPELGVTIGITVDVTWVVSVVATVVLVAASITHRLIVPKGWTTVSENAVKTPQFSVEFLLRSAMDFARFWSISCI